jgi:exodeoxyribonuclease VII small subunit
LSSASNRKNGKQDAAGPEACDELSFEQGLTQLEQIVHQLEDGDLDLSLALQQYEQGVKHLRRCFDLLSQAERKIELLTGVDAQGNPVTEPFGDDPTALSEQAGKRRQTGGGRRSAANRPPAGDVDDSEAVF